MKAAILFETPPLFVSSLTELFKVRRQVSILNTSLTLKASAFFHTIYIFIFLIVTINNGIF